MRLDIEAKAPRMIDAERRAARAVFDVLAARAKTRNLTIVEEAYMGAAADKLRHLDQHEAYGDRGSG